MIILGAITTNIQVLSVVKRERYEMTYYTVTRLLGNAICAYRIGIASRNVKCCGAS